jgi:hypothetical protein
MVFRVVVAMKSYEHPKTSQVNKGSSEHVSEFYSLNAELYGNILYFFCVWEPLIYGNCMQREFILTK